MQEEERFLTAQADRLAGARRGKKRRLASFGMTWLVYGAMDGRGMVRLRARQAPCPYKEGWRDKLAATYLQKNQDAELPTGSERAERGDEGDSC